MIQERHAAARSPRLGFLISYTRVHSQLFFPSRNDHICCYPMDVSCNLLASYPGKQPIVVGYKGAYLSAGHITLMTLVPGTMCRRTGKHSNHRNGKTYCDSS